MRMRKGAICSNASLLNWIVKCNGREKSWTHTQTVKNFVLLGNSFEQLRHGLNIEMRFGREYVR